MISLYIYICYAFQYKPQGSIVYKQKENMYYLNKNKNIYLWMQVICEFCICLIVILIFLWLRESYILAVHY